MKNLKIFHRMMLIVIVVAIGSTVTGIGSWYVLQDNLYEDRRIKTRNLVETAYKLIEHYGALEKSGEMSREDAQKAASAAVKNLRYNENDYFWINDYQPAMVMHPFKPALDGKDLSSFKDPNGTFLFKEMVAVVEKEGSGFVPYLWPKPGMDAPVKKISYVKGYRPWNWIVGSGIYIDDIEGIIWEQMAHFGLVFATMLIIIIGTILVIARAITRPLNAMSGAMQRLANGDVEVDVPAIDRGDEIGGMAKTVEVFKENAQKLIQLSLTENAQKERYEYRQAAVNELINEFEQATTELLNDFATIAGSMSETSRTLLSASAETHRQAQSAAGSADQACTSVQSVASACEELSYSVQEINRRVAEASSITSIAVGEAKATNETVIQLTEAAGKIGDVVGLINDITSRTNLLALNATIEAARAGDAGKGFAVVANEVKNLASQTAKATEDIVAQVTTVQEQVGKAVDGIGGISETIDRINAIAGEIATAVDQQGVATDEIASSAQTAASGTSEVEQNMGVVRGAAETTGNVAHSVETTTELLRERVESIRDRISNFIAATHSADDRRRHIRIKARIPVLVESRSGKVETKTGDISLGGLLVATTLNAKAGEAVHITFLEHGLKIPATIVGHSEAGSHVELNADAKAFVRLQKLIDSVASQERSFTNRTAA